MRIPNTVAPTVNPAILNPSVSPENGIKATYTLSEAITEALNYVADAQAKRFLEKQLEIVRSDSESNQDLIFWASGEAMQSFDGLYSNQVPISEEHARKIIVEALDVLKAHSGAQYRLEKIFTEYKSDYQYRCK